MTRVKIPLGNIIRAGFLSTEDRSDLIGLARDGSATHRLTRRANALVLLDAGWNCQEVAGALLLMARSGRGTTCLFRTVLRGWRGLKLVAALAR